MSNVNVTPGAPAPAPYAPTVATAVSLLRMIILVLSGTAFGAKYLPPDFVAYLNANLSTVILSVAGTASVLYGLYKTTRASRIKSAAALPGATVALTSQAEADSHPTESVVGPAELLTIPKAA